MRDAYLSLHQLGHAHSVEIWRAGHMIGGLYGVLLGRVFFGESMFSSAANGSKLALAHLVKRCIEDGTALIDCQMPSAHLRSLGSRPMARAEFVRLLARFTLQ
jgi:leucyl/phenylalanyl-tRNA--protein transferase